MKGGLYKLFQPEIYIFFSLFLKFQWENILHVDVLCLMIWNILWVLCIDFAFIYDLSSLWCLFLQAVARNSETPQQSEEKGGNEGVQGAKNQVIARFTLNYSQC